MTEPSKGRTLQEIVEMELIAYDSMESEERFPVLYLLKEIEDKYLVTVVAPLVGDLHPAEMIKEAGVILRADAKLPEFDLAMVLVDTWGYPQKVRDLGKGPNGEKTMNALYRLLPPSQHPNKVTISMCQLAFRDGHNEMVTQTKGEPSSSLWVDDRESSKFIKGRIIEALRTLVD